MISTQTELSTRALKAHSPVILVTRVEENSKITNTDQVPFDFLWQTNDCMVCHHSFTRSELFSMF